MDMWLSKLTPILMCMKVANKIFNINVESIKIVTKMQTMDRLTKNPEDENFLKILVKIGQISTKNALFYKNGNYSQSHFAI